MKIKIYILVFCFIVSGCGTDSSVSKNSESNEISTTVLDIKNGIVFLPNENTHGKFVLQPASRASDSTRVFCHLKVIENQPCIANQLAHFLCHAVGAFGFDEADSEAA